jgi:hypothetical protein
MSNIEDNDVTLIGKTIRNDDDSTSLIISKELDKELKIDNSKVSMSLVKNSDGSKYLIISKLYKEIIIN